jgi:hypothetical protein
LPVALCGKGCWNRKHDGIFRPLRLVYRGGIGQYDFIQVRFLKDYIMAIEGDCQFLILEVDICDSADIYLQSSSLKCQRNMHGRGGGWGEH